MSPGGFPVPLLVGFYANLLQLHFSVLTLQRQYVEQNHFLSSCRLSSHLCLTSHNRHFHQLCKDKLVVKHPLLSGTKLPCRRLETLVSSWHFWKSHCEGSHAPFLKQQVRTMALAGLISGNGKAAPSKDKNEINSGKHPLSHFPWEFLCGLSFWLYLLCGQGWQCIIRASYFQLPQLSCLICRDL